MKSSLKLSIILPVYNKIDCIENCIKSLLNQGVNDIAEAIFVDDGSTDDTLSVLNKYKLKYPNFIKVISKSNGGVSSARNIGIKNAIGEWVLFVDPDDYLAPNVLSKIIGYYDRDDIDIIRFGVKIADGYGYIDSAIKLDDEVEFCGGTKEYFSCYGVTTSFAHLIRRIHLEKLHFDEELSYWEDLLLMCNLLLQGKNLRILRTTITGYYYVHNSNSVTNIWSRKACLKRIDSTLLLIKKLLAMRDTYKIITISGKESFLLQCFFVNLLRGQLSYSVLCNIRREYNSLRKERVFRLNLKTNIIDLLMMLPCAILYLLSRIYAYVKC